MRDVAARPGLAGRTLHPPFTDFPIAAYIFTAAFDISSIIGHRHGWAAEFWHAGTFVLAAGVSICLLTVATGFIDLFRIPDHGPDLVRTLTVHVCAMVAVFMAGAGELAWRLSAFDQQAATPPGVAIVSAAAAIGVCVGAAYGGSLVFHHGVGVTTVEPGRPGDSGQPAGTGRPGPGIELGTEHRGVGGAATAAHQLPSPARAPIQAARHRLRRASDPVGRIAVRRGPRPVAERPAGRSRRRGPWSGSGS